MQETNMDLIGNITHVQDSYHEVRCWLEDAVAGKTVAYTPQDGFIRIAFTHAFRHLAQQTCLLDALQETLAGFGDTDTNAAVVCGLLGARDGFNAIPKPMWEAVISSNTERGRLRPHWLSMAQLPEVVVSLVDCAPMHVKNPMYSVVNPFAQKIQDAAIAADISQTYKE